MKRVISMIITTIVVLNTFVSFIASAKTVDVNLPAYDCELGFIFETDGVKFNNTNPNDYDGIDTVFDELNIYYAASLDKLKAIADIFSITSWEENYEIEVPEIPEIDIEDVINESISLFSVDETEEGVEISTDEPYVNDSWFEWQWYYEAVHAQAYRDNGIDGTGVKVGIIDSGFNSNLEDFNYDNITMRNVISIIMKEERTMDDTVNHGVPVTSIIAAQANNNIGIAGLTDNVQVYIYKAEEEPYGMNPVAIEKAYVMAYEDGCNVINMSYGGYRKSESAEKLINYLTNKGIICVAAGGNNGNEAAAEDNYNALELPAAYINVIGVGAIAPTYEQEKIYYNTETYQKDEKNNIPVEYRDIAWIWYPSEHLNNEYKKAVFSTANDSIFVSAPGIGMHMYGSNNAKINKYGTSFASPIIAAAAIGVKQMRPYVDTDMFKEILKATSVDLDEEGYDINTGWGMVDFQAIYDYVSEMPETIPEKTPEIAIDYVNNQLTGFDESEYMINGSFETAENGTINIVDDWYDTTVSIIKKASKNGYSDSEEQNLYIPIRPSAPIIEGGYEKISGLDNTMEYRISGSDVWLSTDESELSNISAGTYEVRIAATESYFSSLPTQVTVLKKEKETTPNIEIDYENSVLKGFSDEKVYQINETEITPLNGEYAIPEMWFGTAISIVIKASSDIMVDSEPQILTIPTIPSAPNFRYEIIFDDEGSVSNVSGITEKMEFRKVGLNEWYTGQITDAGEYEIRYKATDNSFASFSYVVTFEDKEIEASPEPTTEPVHEYDVETAVSYENGEVRYSYTNYTDKDISAVGIIAVYDTNSHFIGMRTINDLNTGTNSNVFPVTGDIGSIKFFVWKRLTDLQPYDKAQMSVWE